MCDRARMLPAQPTLRPQISTKYATQFMTQ
jgi:hypothetical protein